MPYWLNIKASTEKFTRRVKKNGKLARIYRYRYRVNYPCCQSLNFFHVLLFHLGGGRAWKAKSTLKRINRAVIHSVADRTSPNTIKRNNIRPVQSNLKLYTRKQRVLQAILAHFASSSAHFISGSVHFKARKIG